MTDCLERAHFLLDEVYIRPKVYTFIDTFTGERFVFMGPYNDTIQGIIKKYNKPNAGFKSLKEEDKVVLENYYTKDIHSILNHSNSVIIECFINDDDTIDIIKKKLMTMVEKLTSMVSIY